MKFHVVLEDQQGLIFPCPRLAHGLPVDRFRVGEAAKLATVVVLTGVFEVGAIGLAFARIVGLGVAIGVAVGWTAAAINRAVRGTQVLFVCSLFAPYSAYFLAEHAGASGVIAVVIAGFVASWRLHYISPESRVDLYASWDQLSFVLNAVMFLFVGLEVPHRLQAAVETAPGILGSALGISAAVIAARFVWIFPGAYLPLWLLPRLRRFEGGYPDPRAVLLGAWCGVRGAVSLAAALSIPLALRDGTAFPGRAEIVTCTLVVILVTLIGQGLTLLPLVRRLGLSDADPTDVEVLSAGGAVLSGEPDVSFNLGMTIGSLARWETGGALARFFHLGTTVPRTPFRAHLEIRGAAASHPADLSLSGARSGFGHEQHSRDQRGGSGDPGRTGRERTDCRVLSRAEER